MANIKNVLLILAFGLLCAFGGYCYGLHCDGPAAASVGQQIDSAQSAQRELTQGIGDVASIVKDAGRIIGECQSIIQQIRNQSAK